MVKKNNYAFIDAQNLHLGVTKNIIRNNKLLYKGWELDMKKLFIYLKEHLLVDKSYLFLGYLLENKEMYNKFQKIGYTLIFKETVRNYKGQIKGNVDAELVLHSAAIEFENYNKAIIISGDGDFTCLIDFLRKNDKFKTVLAPNRFNCSRLLKKSVKGNITFLEFLQNKIGKQKRP